MREALYPVMFTRRSVRKYAPDPLSPQTLATLDAFVHGIDLPDPSAKVAVQLLEPAQVGRGTSKAPHFAVAYAAPDRISGLCAGYLLQYLALQLAQQGLGCCYNGMAKPKADFAVYRGMPYAMTLAFGTPAEPAARTGPSAFQRRPVEEIAGDTVPGVLAEAVRVAPSAVNGQPWFLSGNSEKIELRYAPKGLKSALTAGMALVDLGIAMAHLELAAAHQELGHKLLFPGGVKSAAPKKQEPVCTLLLSQP